MQFFIFYPLEISECNVLWLICFIMQRKYESAPIKKRLKKENERHKNFHKMTGSNECATRSSIQYSGDTSGIV